MKESRQEHQRKGKVNQSINGKQKDSAQKETLVVPSHDENKRGTSKHPSSLAAEPQTKEKRCGKSIERKVSQRPVSVWEEKSKTVQRLHQWECTNPSCNSWHSPVCQNHKTESVCKFGEKFSSMHKEADSQTNDRVPGLRDAAIQFDFTEGSEVLFTW